jgi:hypothetical protein
MQSKKPRKAGKKPKKRKRAKPRSPADPKERLKPISLYGMEFDDVVRRLVKAGPSRERR